MPPEERDIGLLWDVLNLARKIRDKVKDVTFEEYFGNEDLHLVCDRRLDPIAQAASRISDEFKASHPEIPWARIRAQRNVLAHRYGSIDYKLIWTVVRQRIPELIAQIELIVPKAPPVSRP